MVNDGQWVDIGTVLATKAATKASEQATTPTQEIQSIVARFAGEASVKKKQLVTSYVERDAAGNVLSRTGS